MSASISKVLNTYSFAAVQDTSVLNTRHFAGEGTVAYLWVVPSCSIKRREKREEYEKPFDEEKKSK